MSQIVNNDKLTFVLTSYGLSRIAEALNNPLEEITLSKIKLGDANGEYYDPTETLAGNPNPSLVHPIEGAEFYLVEKDLLADGLTVCLHAIIPEESGGYDIREVGLYETILGVDKLFAVSTQQPFVKPTVADNYLIMVDYYMYLKSQNFANVYDQIIINSETGLVTVNDIDEYLKTVLFSQASIMDQVGHNSHIIGLDRAGQLQRKIKEDRNKFGYYALYNSYSTLMSEVDSSSILGFWVFDYPRRTFATPEVPDISQGRQNMTCDQSINVYDQQYSGILSELGFTGDHFYSIPSSVDVSLLNPSRTADSNFSMIFCINPQGTETRTLLAKSDESLGIKVFEVKELAGKALQITLFTNSSNYIQFTSASDTLPAGEHALVLSYKASSKSMTAFANGVEIPLVKTTTGTYTHMNDSVSTIYGYTATPVKSIYADSSTNPTVLRNQDGTPANAYWSISGGKVYYNTTEATLQSGVTTTLDPLYAWVYDGHYVYVKDSALTSATVLYNEDYTVYDGIAFELVQSGSSYIIQWDGHDTTHDSTHDIASITLYQYACSLEPQSIWADSSITPTVLFNENGTRYSGSDWIITGGYAMYLGQYQGFYNSTLDKTLQDISVSSFITDNNGNMVDPVNSYVSIVSIVKEKLSPEKIKDLSLLFSSGVGVNPCVGTY